MEFKLSVQKRVSSKNNEYVGLFINNGGRDICLTVKTVTISEVADISITKLNQMAIGEVIYLN